MQAIHDFVERLQRDKRHRETIVSTNIVDAREPVYADFQVLLSPLLIDVMQEQGISRLYSHQAEAIGQILARKSVVISSGVASGKSLCYQLPILNSLILDPKSRVLMLYPTKALAQDQTQKMTELCALLTAKSGEKIYNAIYDGDTPAQDRSRIRK
ncbi:MAG: DEAD/DEAH box helicase, partial [Candidatus Cloacimonetes bacterium]|nr:DEAD/DEAH box helicase [Candidatus Cloacimonadota bacterium]